MTEAQVLLSERAEPLDKTEENRSDIMAPSAFQLQVLPELVTTKHPSDASHKSDEPIVFQWDDEELKLPSSPASRDVYTVDYILMAAMFAVITFLWMQ